MKPLVGIGREVDDDLRAVSDGAGDHMSSITSPSALRSAPGLLVPPSADGGDVRARDPERGEVGVEIRLLEAAAELDDRDRLARAVDRGRKVVGVGHLRRSERGGGCGCGVDAGVGSVWAGQDRGAYIRARNAERQ